jgi:hypothetical protein
MIVIVLRSVSGHMTTCTVSQIYDRMTNEFEPTSWTYVLAATALCRRPQHEHHTHQSNLALSNVPRKICMGLFYRT